MSFQHIFVALGIVAASAVAPSATLAAQTPASAHEGTRSAVILANARRAVLEDRTHVARLEEIIEHQKAAVFAEGWTLPSLDQWDRLVTPGQARKALASLEVKLERAKRNLVRDQALVDSLEVSVLSTL
jgi:hypothetical protein